MNRSLGWLMALWMVLGGVAAPAAELRIVTEEWPPFNYRENGRPAGFAVELLQLALKDLGKSTPVEFLPWERAYETARATPNVLIFTMARKPERESLFKWVFPIHPRTTYLYKLKRRDDVRIRNIEDAKRYLVGTVGENDAATIDLKNYGFRKDKNLSVLHGSDEQNVHKLAAKRIDLMVATEPQMNFSARKAGYDPGDFERTIPISPKDEYYFFAFSMDTDDATVLAFRNAFEKLKSDGRYETVRRKYVQ